MVRAVAALTVVATLAVPAAASGSGPIPPNGTYVGILAESRPSDPFFAFVSNVRSGRLTGTRILVAYPLDLGGPGTILTPPATKLNGPTSIGSKFTVKPRRTNLSVIYRPSGIIANTLAVRSSGTIKDGTYSGPVKSLDQDEGPASSGSVSLTVSGGQITGGSGSFQPVDANGLLVPGQPTAVTYGPASIQAGGQFVGLQSSPPGRDLCGVFRTNGTAAGVAYCGEFKGAGSAAFATSKFDLTAG